MAYSPVLLVHISGGTVGLLSGAAAMALPKGSRGHALAGTVFFVSMLTMATAALFLAVMRQEFGNMIGAVFTFYLVGTAWATARRRDGETGKFDGLAILAPVAVGAANIFFGVMAARTPSGTLNGVPAGMCFFMGAVALLAAAGDVRMLLRGGVFGAQRIVRHLWRMCFGLFIATGSIFIARPQLFPAVLVRWNVIFLLGIAPFPLMIFWFLRVRLAKAWAGRRRLTAQAQAAD